MLSRPQGSAPRDVKCPSSPAEAKHAAYASPCMFSRLERDVIECFLVLHMDFGHPRLGYETHPEECFDSNLVIMCHTWRRRGRQSPHSFEWRFDIHCVYTRSVFLPSERSTAEKPYSPKERLSVLFLDNRLLGIWSWDWLLA